MIQVDTSAFQAEPIGTHEELMRVEALSLRGQMQG